MTKTEMWAALLKRNKVLRDAGDGKVQIGTRHIRAIMDHGYDTGYDSGYAEAPDDSVFGKMFGIGKMPKN